MGRNKDIVTLDGSTPSYYRKQMHEFMRKPVLNKKQERCLRRQQLTNGFTEDMPILDQPAVIVDIAKPAGEEDSVATVKDWELRMIHQAIRLEQVKNEATRRNVPLPGEWVLYEAKLTVLGTPTAPTGLAAE